MDLFIEAVLWITKTGAPWLDLPGLFGNWKGSEAILHDFFMAESHSMRDAIARRHFLGIAGATGVSSALATQLAGAATSAADNAPSKAAATRSRPSSILDQRDGLRRREPGQPEAIQTQGRGTGAGPAHPRDLAAGGGGRRVRRDRPALPARRRHGHRPCRSQESGQRHMASSTSRPCNATTSPRLWARDCGRECRSGN